MKKENKDIIVKYMCELASKQMNVDPKEIENLFIDIYESGFEAGKIASLDG